ncbi:hypothetical protein QWY96_18095 [Vibrio artabrorum]|uniref:Uncharacterized protein n=1 Tax=Vibrio artabrorum TaxID=446374 RepID=A0ABT8CLW1_9VIBR|nr:hypothetical protein [Vibrio artabrorum]MDN3702345.1 hypothetical protein [Vibrio artabrorum]
MTKKQAKRVGSISKFNYATKPVDTPTEAIRRRFDNTSEQFFTWLIIPLSIINGGIWLNGLGVFGSAVFDADITTTIWITGLAVLAISLLSGAWGVVASDFIQTLVIAIVSIACAIVALVAVGGPGKLSTTSLQVSWLDLI